MLSAVAPRVFRSFTVLLSREVSSVGSPSVSRPVVLLEDILLDQPRRGSCKSGIGSGSEKGAISAHRNENADSSPLRAGPKLCSKSCSGCPRSAANSKLKGKVVGRLPVSEVKEKGESSVHHSPTSLEDSFVSRVNRTIETRFRTR